MPRETKSPIVMLALSPAAVATALGIRPDEVADAIRAGLLPVFVKGTKRRVLVSDVEKFVRGWKQPTPRKKKDVVPCRT